ncbi:hypothetical protein DEJ13_09765 [Curtobacterium sp. MCLR17_007]|uniref:hypothetical protein n=1 Tax=Curtobacterium sp. MCLR17_007 TaxID=2175648 RepID=UPI000DAA51EB|nr:hypothetical protein [Curtobacterium sp. MCLR17_007]WIB58760.1 hypothetical protein DEJ13_09765 [Curtobacterium sp. MCLR17_007]
MDFTPSHTFLQAVRLLHQRGWESVRVFPELYEIGDWRCWLNASGFGSGRRPFRMAVYLGSEDWEMPFEHDPSDPLTPEQIADGLEPGLDDRARQADPSYGPWFEELLRRSGPDALPVFRGGGLARGAGPAVIGQDGELTPLDMAPEPPEPIRATTVG